MCNNIFCAINVEKNERKIEKDKLKISDTFVDID